MFNEANRKQVLEMQAECYAKRIGKVYGDFEVVDVWYDWEQKRQMWKLVCQKCGKEKITHNWRDYRKGKNKGVCGCEAEKARSEKVAAQQKRLDDLPSNPKWIGQVIGNWTVKGYVPHKGWLVECQLCGREVYHYPGSIKAEKQVKCLCEFNYGKYKAPEWMGRRFGSLVTVKYVTGDKNGFICKCDCGREVFAKPTHLTDGMVKSCGQNECEYHQSLITTHGMSKERLYRIWRGMKHRCYDPKSHGYPTYGGRGIDICPEWRNDVLAFMEWAKANGYSDDLSIDRIDNDRGYYPDNCRWATAVEQANNQHPKYTFSPKPPRGTIKHKRTLEWEINGETKSAIEWCEQYGVSVQFATYRIKVKGMTPYEALTTPKETEGRPKKSDIGT